MGSRRFVWLAFSFLLAVLPAHGTDFKLSDGGVVRVTQTRRNPEAYRFQYGYGLVLSVPLTDHSNEYQSQVLLGEVALQGDVEILALPQTSEFDGFRRKTSVPVAPISLGAEVLTLPFLIRREGLTHLLVLYAAAFEECLIWQSAPMTDPEVRQLQHKFQTETWSEHWITSLGLPGSLLASAPSVGEALNRWFVSPEAEAARHKRELNEPDENFWQASVVKAKRGFSRLELQDLAQLLDPQRYPLVRAFLTPEDVAPFRLRNRQELLLLRAMQPADLIYYADLNPSRLSDLIRLTDVSEPELLPVVMLRTIAAAASDRRLRRTAIAKISELKHARKISEAEYLSALVANSAELPLADQVDRAHALSTNLAACRFSEVRALFARVIDGLDPKKALDSELHPDPNGLVQVLKHCMEIVEVPGDGFPLRGCLGALREAGAASPSISSEHSDLH